MERAESNSSETITIALEGVVLRGYHGVMEQERKVGNDFEFFLSVDVQPTEGMAADELEGTLSYADLFEVVKEESETPSHLLEHLALRIAKRVKERWQAVQRGEIKIVKLSPPIPGILGRAWVKLNF